MNLSSVPPHVWIALSLLALLLAAAQALSATARRWSRRRRIHRQIDRAQDGEAWAEQALRAAGYQVEGRQVSLRYPVWVDRQPEEITLRADFVVRDGPKRFVAEVKTGQAAPRLSSSATRRQLLEYRVAFDVDGVLLVDAEARTLHLVEFPLSEREQPARLTWLGWLLAGAALGALLVIVLR